MAIRAQDITFTNFLQDSLAGPAVVNGGGNRELFLLGVTMMKFERRRVIFATLLTNQR